MGGELGVQMKKVLTILLRCSLLVSCNQNENSDVSYKRTTSAKGILYSQNSDSYAKKAGSEGNQDDGSALTNFYDQRNHQNLFAGVTETGVHVTQSYGEADCNMHLNRQPGDLCAYNFCGTASQNGYLSAEVYKTVKSLMVQLNSKGLVTSPCTNSSIISTLTSLTSLDLSSSDISDLSPLLNLKSLKELNLDNNQIKDLSYLRNMSVLTILSVNQNLLADLSGISGIQSLTTLYAANNKLTYATDLVDLKNLKSVDLSNNQIVSILPLTQGQKLGINVTGNPGIYTEVSGLPASSLLLGATFCENINDENFTNNTRFACFEKNAYLLFNTPSTKTPIIVP